MKEKQEHLMKDYAILLAGFLGGLQLILSDLGIYEISADLIDGIVSTVSYAVVGYAIWKNTYVSKKAQVQRKKLEESNLIK